MRAESHRHPAEEEDHEPFIDATTKALLLLIGILALITVASQIGMWIARVN